MKKLMLLHNRHTPDDQDIWKVAINRGWSTARVNQHDVKEAMEGYDYVRYYGNTLHGAQIESQLPIRFLEIDYEILEKLDPLYVGRNIEYLKFKDVKQPIERDCFIKPARDKFFEAKVYRKGDVIQGAPQGDDQTYVSDIVSFADEVRCFVLNGKVLTSSLYRIGKISYQEIDMPPEHINFDKQINDTLIPKMVRAICDDHPMPKGFVIDFGRIEGGNDWFVIEFNEAWACGLYYCNPEKCFDVIEASECAADLFYSKREKEFMQMRCQRFMTIPNFGKPLAQEPKISMLERLPHAGL